MEYVNKVGKKKFVLKFLLKVNIIKGNNGYNIKIWYCKIIVVYKVEIKCEVYVIVSIYMYKMFMILIE